MTTSLSFTSQPYIDRSDYVVRECKRGGQMGLPTSMREARTYIALIRTHHITSRKKITKLKQAAGANNVCVLLRTGGSPGMMFVEGEAIGVQSWIDVVHKLRYKDYQLAARPVEHVVTSQPANLGSLEEVDTVRNFAETMRVRGVFDWWRSAMGYAQPQD